ncbi:hypothetical protein J4Q44_G00363260 [Coregonus suidteri]|uniref:Uncharacterized protein n=1 Tax=Coregonus suidteri TaxID=861788 RepID=A0AAN8KV90_9TELE
MWMDQDVEGKGDLGVTSYLTDADGNVIIGSKSRTTTPSERRKSVTGKNMHKREASRVGGAERGKQD